MSRAKLYAHKHAEHNIQSVWNKGLTKDTDSRLAKANKTLREHISSGKVHLNVWKDKHLPDEIRSKISSSMKKAHVEGRAHNIGESRWNNKPSYPEKWFMEVVQNEFDDKSYVREMPFHRFALDFAWVEKKRCIEIDGEQHDRFVEYKKRDIEKDALLKQEGWSVLRLSWKDVCQNTKYFIKIAKDFIDT